MYAAGYGPRVFILQAEDGIRYLTVTGVQSCALPISDPLGGCPVPLLGEGALHSRQERVTVSQRRRLRVALLLRDEEAARTVEVVVLVERERRRSEEHTSELQSPSNLVCRLLLEKKTR